MLSLEAQHGTPQTTYRGHAVGTGNSARSIAAKRRRPEFPHSQATAEVMKQRSGS